MSCASKEFVLRVHLGRVLPHALEFKEFVLRVQRVCPARPKSLSCASISAVSCRAHRTAGPPSPGACRAPFKNSLREFEQAILWLRGFRIFHHASGSLLRLLPVVAVAAAASSGGRASIASRVPYLSSRIGLVAAAAGGGGGGGGNVSVHCGGALRRCYCGGVFAAALSALSVLGLPLTMRGHCFLPCALRRGFRPCVLRRGFRRRVLRRGFRRRVLRRACPRCRRGGHLHARGAEPQL